MGGVCGNFENRMMSVITVELSKERIERLKEMATRLSISPEELARAGLEDWLGGPKEQFRKAAEYVMSKNAELYRRLA